MRDTSLIEFCEEFHLQNNELSLNEKLKNITKNKKCTFGFTKSKYLEGIDRKFIVDDKLSNEMLSMIILKKEEELED